MICIILEQQCSKTYSRTGQAGTSPCHLRSNPLRLIASL